ncbi:MAG TPA: SRPBCC family protein, partial [Pirellulales bacterium]|nr:SRPBCC family protein [Pirellulales bacterium]
LGGREQVNTAEATLAAPPAVVFAWITKPAKIKQWVEGITEIEPLTTSGHAVGAKSKIIIEEQGSRFEIRDEVTRSEPDRLVEVRMTSDMFDVTNLFELADEQGKTHLKQTMQAHYKGLARVFAPFVGGIVQQKLNEDFARLKQLAESQQGEAK